MKRNVLLVILDACRYDHFLPEVCPFMWGLGERGIRFENYFSCASWSLPAHASLFTGLHVREHNTEYENMILHPSIPTLAERFKEQGYQTAAFCNNPWVGPATGLDRGFEKFYGIWHKAFLGKTASKRFSPELKGKIKSVMEFAKYRDYADSGSVRTNKKIKNWRKKEYDKEKPYFIFINYMETHGTLKPPEPYRSQFYKGKIPWDQLEQDFRKTISGEVNLSEEQWEGIKQLQKGEIAYIDSIVRELVEKVLKGTNPVVAITADHGDLFGDEDLLGKWAGHKYSLNRNLLHVPLVISGLLKNTIYSGMIQHTDLFRILVNDPQDLPKEKKFGFAEHTNPKLFLDQFQDSVQPLREGTDIKKLQQHLLAVFDEKNHLVISDKNGTFSQPKNISVEEEGIMHHALDSWLISCKAPPPPTGTKLEFDEAEKIMLNLGLF